MNYDPESTLIRNEAFMTVLETLQDRETLPVNEIAERKNKENTTPYTARMKNRNLKHPRPLYKIKRDPEGKIVWPDDLKDKLEIEGIYYIFDHKNNRGYFGIGGGKCPNNRLGGRLKQHFNNAYRGYPKQAVQDAILLEGEENVGYTIVEPMPGSTKSERQTREGELIKEYETKWPKGYNGESGGKSPPYTIDPALANQLRKYAESSGESACQTLRDIVGKLGK